MKKNNKSFDFGNRMDLNADRYGPSATQSNIDFKSLNHFKTLILDSFNVVFNFFLCFLV